MNKRRWRLVIFAAIILIVAFTMQFREKNKEAAISAILDQAAQIDSIELFKGEKSIIRLTGEDAATNREKYPLSHVRNLSKKERAIFEEKPAYRIAYKIKDKTLYEVDILKVAISSELSEELQQMVFRVGEQQYLIYWENEKKALEQSTSTQLLLEQYGK